jgi:hypothetical protein
MRGANVNDEGEWQAGGFCPVEDQARMGMSIAELVGLAARCYVDAAADPGLTRQDRWQDLLVSLAAGAGIEMEVTRAELV